MIPALLTRMSTRPNASRAALTSRSTSAADADVAGDGHRVRAAALQLAEDVLRGVVVAAIVEGDLRAGLGQPDRDRPADAARAAGDQRDLAAAGRSGTGAPRPASARSIRNESPPIVMTGASAPTRHWPTRPRGRFSLMVRTWLPL